MNVDRPVTFGELLRRFREAAGLTQEELAERAGLSVDAIGLLEREARQRPQRYTVQRLVDALQLSGDERSRFETAARASRQTNVPGRSNLPNFATPLIGRDDTLAAIVRLLEAPDARIVTLTGPGGVGKTRLAVAVARQIESRFADGVTYVPLAALSDPVLVTPAIGQALGIRESPQMTDEQRLREYLERRPLLLVLDNFEHLLLAAHVVAALSSACPNLTVLITSRAPLHLTGEHQLSVAPLDVPDNRQSARLSLERLTDIPAVALFEQRARAVQPGFAVSSANRDAVAEICRRLDGLPLAIELAAAWVKVLSPNALLRQLDRALPILADGPRDLPARQQSLHATIDWSHDLLAESERILFRRLSTFVGGGTLPAVTAVCLDDAAGSPTVLLGLAGLIDKSLVQSRADVLSDGSATPDVGAEDRFTMLETIRAFAAERLSESGERDAIEQRHAAYYLAFTEEAQAHLVGPDEARWLLRLEEEHPNLRAALRWAIDRREVGMAVRFSAVLWRFWASRGHLSEGRRWLNQVLALADSVDDETVTPAQRAMLLHVTAILTRVQGDYEVAKILYRRCLDIRRGLNDLHGIGGALHNLGIVAYEQGQYAEAGRLLREALNVNRQVGQDYGIAFALVSLADVVRAQDDLGQAISLYEEGLARFRGIEHTWGVALALKGLADATLAQGKIEQADSLYRESLTLSCRLGDTLSAIPCLEGLAQTASARMELARAARLLGAAALARETLGASRSPAQSHSVERVLSLIRADLAEGDYTAAWEDGEDLAREEDARALLGLLEPDPA